MDNLVALIDADLHRLRAVAAESDTAGLRQRMPSLRLKTAHAEWLRQHEDHRRDFGRGSGGTAALKNLQSPNSDITTLADIYERSLIRDVGAAAGFGDDASGRKKALMDRNRGAVAAATWPDIYGSCHTRCRQPRCATLQFACRDCLTVCADSRDDSDTKRLDRSAGRGDCRCATESASK